MSIPELHITPWVLTEDAPTRKYTSNKDEQSSRNNPNDGQLKLLVGEMLFFAHCRNSVPDGDHMPVLVVYVGAGPGTHLPPLLTHLISKTMWNFYLYDPTKFDEQLVALQKSNAQRLTLIQRIFTDKDAAEYAQAMQANKCVLFISDIRNEVLKDEKNRAIQIANDLKAQESWVRKIKPTFAYLKFRFPWPENGVIPNCKYLPGKIFLQAFAPQNSTETRLVVCQNDTQGTFNYNPIKYDNQLCYINNILRPSDFDMQLATLIFQLYKARVDPHTSLADLAQKFLTSKESRCWQALRDRLSR
jgi:hypothetical protein